MLLPVLLHLLRFTAGTACGIFSNGPLGYRQLVADSDAGERIRAEPLSRRTTCPGSRRVSATAMPPKSSYAEERRARAAGAAVLAVNALAPPEADAGGSSPGSPQLRRRQ